MPFDFHKDYDPGVTGGSWHHVLMDMKLDPTSIDANGDLTIYTQWWLDGTNLFTGGYPSADRSYTGVPVTGSEGSNVWTGTYSKINTNAVWGSGGIRSVEIFGWVGLSNVFVDNINIGQGNVDMQVTNIKFNWDTGASTNDAINIRKDYSNRFDISNGEWVKGGTNIPFCYTTNKTVTIRARFIVQPVGITNADIWAVTTGSGGFPDVVKTNVYFTNGVSSPEYVTLQLSRTTTNCIQKTSFVWQWRVENTNGSGSSVYDFNTSGVHTVYTILNEPVAPWTNIYDSASNAWTKALDFAVVTASCNGESIASNALSRITQYLHTGHLLTYDIDGGANAYATSYLGGTFRLTQYIDKTGGINVVPPRAGNIVNCYDQAGGVCTLGRLVGISVTYRYMAPFGYINTVNLVGEGNCNNPFYPLSTSGLKIAGADDLWPVRTLFSNHAIAAYGGFVFDACAGPAIGTRTEAQYVADTVDTSDPAEASGPMGPPPWFFPKVCGDPANISLGNVTNIQ